MRGVVVGGGDNYYCMSGVGHVCMCVRTPVRTFVCVYVDDEIGENGSEGGEAACSTHGRDALMLIKAGVRRVLVNKRDSAL